MKILYTVAIVLFLASCSSGDKPKDKKTETGAAEERAYSTQ
jgi:PBP1b-binding outer membrane lipoprotein LpoB